MKWMPVWIAGVAMATPLVVWSGEMRASDALPLQKGDAAKGKTIFGESCRHCHGAEADGTGEMAAYLDPPPSNLTAATTQQKTDDQLRTTILTGRPGTAMSGFEGALTDEQLADVIAYLRSVTR
ncbi:MAG: cytochrome c [Nitrospiraceae bacterium]